MPELAISPTAHGAAIQGIAVEVVPDILTDGVDLAMMAIAVEAEAKAVREGKTATRLQALARGATVIIEL